MQQLVECVPNFSNGRDPAVYETIADAIRSVRGIALLDVSADPDHNRTVITFVGKPEDVEEAAFRAISAAATLIDLDHHTGEHPRIGATDVCPLIPVKGVTVADCIEMAQRLGQRVGEELGIAVYLYGRAATRPEREKLSAIRKGEYELWKEEIGLNPAREPDFGPAVARTWGATVIGVRPFLIAYNLYLNSNDVSYAEKLARSVREISGGLRNVQAKGFLVDGQAQVSMNLLDFEKTPIHRVQELVRREAAQFGLTITRAELVGMVPQKALMEAARWYLQLEEMQDGQVLEYRIAEKDGDITPYDFVDATAAAAPTPGGGSVAALAGALGAALTQMVAGLTTGRKKYAGVEADARVVLADARALREELTAAIAEDAAAFEALMSVSRNKELSDAARAEAVEAATLGAADVPRRVARLSRDVALLAQTIAEVGNVNAASDAAVGALMARTAVQAAALNVRINAAQLRDRALAQSLNDELSELEAETTAVADAAVAIAIRRGGL